MKYTIRMTWVLLQTYEILNACKNQSSNSKLTILRTRT